MLSIRRPVVSVLVTVLAATAGLVGAPASSLAAGGPTVYATGLDNPRGLAFDDRGNLYVAEGGAGGSMRTTTADCQQVAFPVGPYSGGFNARISRILPDGTHQTVASGLPSSQTGPLVGSSVEGVADVAFRHDRLYALEAGAGCSHGLKGTSNGILRVEPDGSTVMVANLSTFLRSHPVANPDNNPQTGDFEPDGTPYAFASYGNSFYVIQPNQQELDRIDAEGNISRVIDFSVTYPGNSDWRGPTTLVQHGRYLYTGTLTPFPTRAGAAQVWRIDPRTGTFSVVASGLSSVLGLAFGEDDSMYVLEMSTLNGGPAPFTGDVVRIHDGSRSVVASGLCFPTAITLGPDGALYVSNFGFGFPPGAGQIVRIPVPTDN